MKFKTGDIVKKTKGYKFVGRVVSAYEVEGGERYDVQVDTGIFLDRFYEMLRGDHVEIKSAWHLMEIEEMLANCHGMIHIFSDSQLELLSPLTKNERSDNRTTT